MGSVNHTFPHIEYAVRILDMNSDPVITYRLKRDLLHIPVTELVNERKSLDTNPWVEQLVQEQHPDGSWGRFHSRDTKTRQKIITTEFGVQRGLALGLDASHPAFCRTVDYLTQLLSAQIDFPDPAERSDCWPLGVSLFTAATLAQLKPNHPFLDPIWNLWAEIAERTFKHGEYDPEAEIRAHQELTGATVKDSYLILNNKYTLILLSARPDNLPTTLSRRLFSWVWGHPDGVRYLGVPPAKLPVDLKPGNLDRWFSIQELLSRFPSWRKYARFLAEYLWTQQDDDGLWDLGPRSTGSFYFPLSANWRKRINRKVDWSIRILLLLSQVDNEVMNQVT